MFSINLHLVPACREGELPLCAQKLPSDPDIMIMLANLGNDDISRRCRTRSAR